MIVVTGGAGFIGSNLVAALDERGVEYVVCDSFGDGEKWRNLSRRAPLDVVAPERAAAYVAGAHAHIDAVAHLGAVSSTTEADVDLILRSNFHASMELWRVCAEKRVRLIYASSAATYGDGAQGFDDAAPLAALRPLNAYGWSKHLFDRRAAALAERAETRPPQWAGLKFFNVYGPNEYHKGSMQSLVGREYAMTALGNPLTLFRSARPDCEHGGQKRDFVHVDDCVAVMLWLLDTPGANGIYNVGTGRARTFLELARILFAALGREENIAWVEMPLDIRAQYQYFTEARLDRLRAAGYAAPFRGLEDGVADYVARYLSADDPYR